MRVLVRVHLSQLVQFCLFLLCRGRQRRINCVEGEAILYIDMGGRLVWEAINRCWEVGNVEVVLIVMGEGIGKKVIKNLWVK